MKSYFVLNFLGSQCSSPKCDAVESHRLKRERIVIRSEKQIMEKFASTPFKNCLSSVNYLEQLNISCIDFDKKLSRVSYVTEICLILRRNISETYDRGSCLWLGLVVKRYLARILAWKPVILTVGFRGFPLSLQGMPG
jgi:hypothetical protein